MIDTTMPIYIRPDGSYAVTKNGIPFGVYEKSNPSEWREVQAYLASLTEEERARVLVPEPVPPEPSAEELAARARAADLTTLADLDRQAIRPLRAIAAGTATQSDRDRLADIEAQADAIRARLA